MNSIDASPMLRPVPLDSSEGLAYLSAQAGECRTAAANLPEAERGNAKWLELAARLFESVRNDYLPGER